MAFDDIIGQIKRRKRYCCICGKELLDLPEEFDEFVDIVCSTSCATEWIKKRKTDEKDLENARKKLQRWFDTAGIEEDKEEGHL